MDRASERAVRFLEEEQAFRLGALVTEAAHPRTRGLSQTLERDVAQGVSLLQAVDRDIVAAGAHLFDPGGYGRLVRSLGDALGAGGRVVFTGCGATGRLSILLEAAWRAFWRDRAAGARWAGRCVSVMAGGDYALIKSVEGFEDFPAFGRRQLRETGAGAGDVVVAISEGGETPFVIGTAWEALDRGAEVFFVYNNPTELLRNEVARSRELLDDPRVCGLDLCTGPMAITGSTRMQATTAELLVVGAALEQALTGLLGRPATGPEQYRETFSGLLAALEAEAVVTALARAVAFERDRYRGGGRVTYWAETGLLDLLTDTTERSPTFMVPPFRPSGDRSGPPPWAFVKHPRWDTRRAWTALLGRPPRGLAWDAAVYRELGAPAALCAAPPDLGPEAVLAFPIGCEADPDRCGGAEDAGVMVHCGTNPPSGVVTCAATRLEACAHRGLLAVGPEATLGPVPQGVVPFVCPCPLPDSPLDLWQHLALKLVLNTLSTATMASLGRVLGNAMVWVSPSNKKLIDRGCRLIAQTTGCSYEAACHTLHACLAAPGEVSPVAAAIARLDRGGR